MPTKSLMNVEMMPSTLFENFFKPWNQWFEGDLFGKMLTVPAVNITEKEDVFKVELAAPGMSKDDFTVDMDGNLLTISASKEEQSEEKDKQFTRKEYNYSSFSRTFTVPEEINKDRIEAKYKDGILILSLPKTELAKKNYSHRIAVN